MTLKRTPLYERHVTAGGKLVPFAGYEMPVQYGSIIAEAKAVREGAGMFDVSHMARLTLSGTATGELLEWVTTNDVVKLKDGGGQYSLLPNAAGGVIDDVILYRRDVDTFELVVNASNHEKDAAWLAERFGLKVQIDDRTAATAMIAVQGPRAAEAVAAESPHGEAIRWLPTFGTVDAMVGGVACFVARSGYTGEDGFELVCAADDATALWNALRAQGVVPCGLASRDTLRVEAGLPLYGHELTEETSPIAAGLGWVVSKTKTFLGSEAVRLAREEGTPRRLVGLRLEGKRLMTQGAAVTRDGEAVGEVTSGVISPTLDCGIGFAYVDSAVKLGTPVQVDLRSRPEPATVVNKRFLRDRAA